VSILNVEDHAPARFLRSRVLERAGYTVREADSAQQAIEALEQLPPRLVLLDVRLPDGDGFSLCERIKGIRPDVAVVIVTAVHNTDDGRREALASGADAFVVEPIVPEQLVEVVQRFVGADRAVSDAAPPPPATVRTDFAGLILSMNPEASRLLNISSRGRGVRSILPFFQTERTRIANGMPAAVGGQALLIDALVRPRQRKPVPVRLDLSVVPEEQMLQWVLETADRMAPTRR
jgi:CheY-like chemotaxis protein